MSAVYTKIYQYKTTSKGTRSLTEPLAELWSPDNRPELHFTYPERALVEDLDRIVNEFVIPMGKEDAAHLRDIPIPPRSKCFPDGL